MLRPFGLRTARHFLQTLENAMETSRRSQALENQLSREALWTAAIESPLSPPKADLLRKKKR